MASGPLSLLTVSMMNVPRGSEDRQPGRVEASRSIGNGLMKEQGKSVTELAHVISVRPPQRNSPLTDSVLELLLFFPSMATALPKLCSLLLPLDLCVIWVCQIYKRRKARDIHREKVFSSTEALFNVWSSRITTCTALRDLDGGSWSTQVSTLFLAHDSC